MVKRKSPTRYQAIIWQAIWNELNDGMMIAVPEEEWVISQGMSSGSFTRTLQQLANKVNLTKFKKHKRGPKKPQAKRNQDSKRPHVSTARLIKK